MVFSLLKYSWRYDITSIDVLLLFYYLWNSMNLIKRDKKGEAEGYMCNSKERTEEKEGRQRTEWGVERKNRGKIKKEMRQNAASKENSNVHTLFLTL